MAIYMKATDITGNVTTQGYNGWIEVNNIDFGANRKMSTRVGRVSDREGGDSHISELTLYKPLDKATPYLFQAFCKHTILDQVEIHVCGSSPTVSPYLKYTLSKAVVSSHQHFAQTDSTPSEEVKLNFTKISLSYIGKDAANRPSSPITVGYDLESNKTL